MIAVLALCGVCGLFGWYTGRWYHHASFGLYIGLAVAVIIYCMVIFDKTIKVLVESIVAFVLGVPLIYGLVLLTQIPLLAFGLISFSAHTFFVGPILGALVGTGVYVLMSLRSAFIKALESETAVRVLGLNWLFLYSVSFWGPFAFLVAGGFVVPEHKAAAMILFGTMWGIVAAAATCFFIVLVDRKPVREEWLPITVVESLLVGGLFYAISDHSALALVLPALLACALTYGLVCLASALRAAATSPAAGLAHRTSAEDDVPPIN